MLVGAKTMKVGGLCGPFRDLVLARLVPFPKGLQFA
jgi:hypothetical protein